MIVHSLCSALLLVQAGLERPQPPPAVSVPSAVATVATTFVGAVVGADGAPAGGAIVVADAGGMAVAAADGSFRLVVEVPLDAASVRLTAVGPGAGRTVGSVGLALSRAGGGTHPVGVLRLSGSSCEPSWLPSFGTLPGAEDNVYAMTMYDAGSGPVLVIGGAFTSVSGVPARSVALWDGTSWSGLGEGTNGAVLELLVHDDGLGGGPALYAAGAFTIAGSTPAENIAKWDGVQWSALAEGRDLRIFCLASFQGSLVAGGDFNPGHVRRWDGIAWRPMGAVGTTVWDLAVFDSGSGPEIYISGSFTGCVKKWDGSDWRTVPGIDIDLTSGAVTALNVFDDGNGSALYIGGGYTRSGIRHCLGRWDGTTFSAVGGLDDTPGVVYTLLAGTHEGQAALFAGGYLAVGAGEVAYRVVRWDGTGWFEVGAEASYIVRDLAQLDGTVYVGGEFLSIGGRTAFYVADWNGTHWSPLRGRGFDGLIWDFEVFDDGSGPALYATGGFTRLGSKVLNSIARYDGARWSPLSTGLDSWGLTLEAFDDGLGGGPALYAGGYFTTAGGTSANRVARWDGVGWSPLGAGMNAEVNDLKVFDAGGGAELYACGGFTQADGLPASRIAKWNGTSWTPVSSGLSSVAFDMAVFDDGAGPALYVAGQFGTAGGSSALRVARWDGTSWSALGSGLNGSGFILQVFDDGNGSGPALYVGGQFTQAGGVPAQSIARWDGAGWSPLGTGLGTPGTLVAALGVFDEGSGPALFASGSFLVAGGVPARFIARWDGTGWSALGSGLDRWAFAMAVYGDGTDPGPTLYVGGQFPYVLDTGDSYLGRWSRADIAPTISHPNYVHVPDTGVPGEVVTYTVTASDACDPAPMLACVPPSGSTFPPGTTTVTCTATDSAGNQATRSFPVIVGTGKIRQR